MFDTPGVLSALLVCSTYAACVQDDVLGANPGPIPYTVVPTLHNSRAVQITGSGVYAGSESLLHNSNVQNSLRAFGC